MRNRRLSTLALLFTILPLAHAAADPAPRATGLRCEYLVNPLGIDAIRPRLSWRMEAGDPAARGVMQGAYRILVSSSPQRLAAGEGDAWDSGKVASDQSVQLEYAGKALAPGGAYCWKVKVWDGNGRESQWSDAARWSMGLLTPADWTAKWVGKDVVEAGGDLFATPGVKWIWREAGAATSAPVGHRFFRRDVTLPAGRSVRAATCRMTADDGFRLLVNGTEVGSGDGHPNPLSVDLTHALREGKNVLAVEAYNKPGPPQNPAGLIGVVRVDFAEGEPLIVATGEHWRAAADAPAGWEKAGFDDSRWQPAATLGDYGIGPWGKITSAQSEHRRLPARMLRREFHADKPVARATAYVCGLGFFELYLNGGKVGDHVMDPAISNYAKHVCYVTFDVTDKLKQGANAVGVILGNGRFFAPRVNVPAPMRSFGFPKLLLKLHVEYADGTSADVVSDESWKLTDAGPIRANSEYDGEEYDARLEQRGWSEPGFDASRWEAAAVVEAPPGQVVAQMVQPMRVTETVPPVGLTSPRPGVWVVDFGQNLYGMVRLKVRGPAGTRVQIRTSFAKKPDGTLKTEDNRSAFTMDSYTLRGGGAEEIWSPRFRGQGTHFAEVTGFPGTPTADNFELLAVHTDFEQVGQFTCSNDLVNRIYANAVRSTRMQDRSVPMEPDRDERQPWLGHPAKTAESEGYIYNVAPFYRHFLAETRSNQRADGNLSDGGWFWAFFSGDPVWPAVIAVVPDWLYDFYADRAALADNYPAAKAWMLFQQRTNLKPNFTTDAGGYGDWVDASSMDARGPDSGGTSHALIATAYFYHNCRLVERAAKLLGKADDQKYFADLADRVGAAFHKRFFNPAAGTYESGTQLAGLLPLTFGLVPPEHRAAVIRAVADDITNKHQNHLSVGLIGMQWYLQALTDAGRPDLAYAVVTQTTRPSWGYMISKGATSVWERWDMDTRDPAMNGESQLILSGDLPAWLYQTLGGINHDPDRPGFKHVILRPRPVGDLTFVRASHESMHGTVASDWRIERGEFRWKVTVPPNTTATVYVPGGTRLPDREGVTFLRADVGATVYEVGSGEYEFRSSDWKGTSNVAKP